MYNYLFFIGIVLVLLGTITIILYTVLNSNTKPENKINAQVGGLIMIGPIPIIFGNSSIAMTIVIILGIILFIIAILFFFFTKK